MIHRSVDAVVVGGGSAGMAAALAMRQAGLSVAIVERDPFLGGILLQCIHSGFGIHEFAQDLTGPEYAERFIGPVLAAGIEIFLDATIMEIAEAQGGKVLTAFSRRLGIVRFSSRAVVLAMGCRERNRGNVAIAGTRPSGVFTAGLAQRLVNVEGCVPGRRAVIIGSGDIGLIMARRLTLIGCTVSAVVEIQPYPSGSVRNIVQCLNDFSIPLYLGHVVVRIKGRDRVEEVEVAPLEEGHPVTAKSFRVPCDTVLLSVGLIPENELSRAAGVTIDNGTGGPWVDADLMTGVEGIFACGNVLHVHDLVDFVTEEARRCGERVAAYLRGEPKQTMLAVNSGANVRYVVPGSFAPGRQNVLFLRPLVVKNDARLEVRVGGQEITSRRLAHVQPSEMIRLSLDEKAVSALEVRNVDAKSGGYVDAKSAGYVDAMEVSIR
jgi:NADPH-dependent 2,4-dienoyl-CoA reductase/sulfur reductase-like enzyme